MNITYYLHGINNIPSTNPIDSDYSYNKVFMDHVVGTLVKYGPSGRVEPYLAKSWQTVENGKVWKFELQPGLFCEDGTSITGESFAVSLASMFQILKGKNRTPHFNDLIGWKAFLAGNDKIPAGISYTNNTITFSFSSPPTSNFLDYISHPYFGFYCPNNWSQNRQWVSNHKIFSSGPYVVSQVTDNNVIMAKRQGWPLLNARAPQKVTIVNQTAEVNIAAVEAQKASIHLIGIKPIPKAIALHNMQLIEGPKAILIALYFSPNKKSGLFQNVEYRKLVRDQIYNLKASLGGAEESSFFYPSFFSVLDKKKSQLSMSGLNSSVLMSADIGLAALSPSGEIFLPDVIEALGKELKPSRILKISENPMSLDQIREIEKQDNYDMFIAGADIGGDLTPSGINFMFCTKLGVSFPDPKGTICRLTQKYLMERNIDNQAYAKEFNQILYEEAWVIPISHEGIKKLITNDIDINSISSTDSHPRFDLIRFKE